MKTEWMQHALLFVPWIKGQSDRRMRIDLGDIVKTVITSAVVAGVVMYGTQRVIEAEINNLKQDFREYKQIVDGIAREQSRRQPMIDFIEKRLQRDTGP